MNYEGVLNDGCSQLYVGDIEIGFEHVVVSQSYYEHEYEYLVANNEEPRVASPSPLKLHEVDQIKEKQEEEVPQ